MIVLMQENSPGSTQARRAMLEERGYRTYSMETTKGPICAALNVKENDLLAFKPYFEDYHLLSCDTPYILAGRNLKDTDTVITLPGGGTIGGGSLCVMAGPCSIESEDQIRQTALAVKASGATVLRGGAFKPRTSPYAFQGMGGRGLDLLRKVGDEAGLPVITEVMDPEDLPLVEEYADIIQIGARNCQNFSLLKKVGRSKKPVLLKRGMMVTINEFLMSAEYILSEGNMNVILCERGIRTFETETRNTLDISAIPVLKQKTHLPVIVDPSHGTGHWKLISPMSKASVAAGADGLMIECHNDPARALCDGGQSLRPDKFDALMKELRPLCTMMGRELV
ncbi:MAG: 3-deoxy-7-phosphoheptulonate synthase [Spirochaetae bacterium HGW-Spirochaetae-1]|nr:MAG: 3-deoxy-7-phosphoheptulonate synthase [Spirochaetae bacterium HGW-Spirochaetae-1]